ncbi:hypothetical protein C4K35_1626 [Pseudomonas chlororaphis subsp. piscium]|nr:hypothetical protein C4K35_1626 [Pseudomonas chlororaphis subsp. piscium]AZC62111.1 hypothetical protein C4K33_1604 [Pseudomonas chlororaphis subsp. piscium]AZC80755.1 hypothetical protein C4K30_1626 [Pseudomonas chlororaphis subsp. piscium]AZC87929.1 hypothetical protein C4K29_1612 [Pseudomonas chlororaphis subsp. piscium]
MTFRIKAVGETARVFYGGVRENPGCSTWPLGLPGVWSDKWLET